MTNDELKRVLTEIDHLKTKRGADRFWDVVGKILAPVVLGLFAWGVLLEVRVSVIESNRFTSADAHELYRRVLSELPPAWLRKDLDEIKMRVRSVESQISAMKK